MNTPHAAAQPHGELWDIHCEYYGYDMEKINSGKN